MNSQEESRMSNKPILTLKNKNKISEKKEIIITNHKKSKSELIPHKNPFESESKQLLLNSHFN